MTMARIFRSDPLLATLTLVLTVAVWFPLFVTPFLPLQDLPDHVGAAALLPDILFGDGLAAHHFQVQLYPLPYWTLYVILGSTIPLVGPMVAAKIAVALALLIVPLGTMRLLVALRRSPRLGLWAFALVWDHNLYWGWVANAIGLGLALFTLARLVEARSPRESLRAWPLAALTALTHLSGVGLLLAGATALAFAERPFRRRLMIHGIGVGAALLVLLPWIIIRMTSSGDGGAILPTEWHTVGHKLSSLYSYTLGNVTGSGAPAVTGLTFACLLLLPLGLAGLRQHEWVEENRGAVVFFLVLLGLYLALPFAIWKPIKHWYLYPRLGSLVLLAALFVPRPRFEGWRALLLAPGVALAIAMAIVVAFQFASFAQRARPFERVIAAVRPNSAVLTLTLNDRDPVMKLGVFNQFHAYVTAAKRGYDPYLFDHPSIPVVYRKKQQLPAPRWNQMHRFSMLRHARHYDYILVQGRRRDPVRPGRLPGGVEVRRVLDAGRWRLYEVRKPKNVAR